MRETLSQAGYVYLYQQEDGLHVLWNTGTHTCERWAKNKGHASYGLRYKNTDLEFCNSFTESEQAHLLGSLRAIQNFGEQHHAFHSTLMRAYRKHLV